MGFVDWLANIDPTTRIGWGMGLVLVGLTAAVLTISHVRDWPSRPAEHRPTHAPRWYRRQTSAQDLLARLRAERLFDEVFEVAEPVGQPINLVPVAFDGAGYRIGQPTYRTAVPPDAETTLTNCRIIDAEPDWLADAFVDTQTLPQVT